MCRPLSFRLPSALIQAAAKADLTVTMSEVDSVEDYHLEEDTLANYLKETVFPNQANLVKVSVSPPVPLYPSTLPW